MPTMGFPVGASGKEPACQYRRHKRLGFNPCVRKIPWRRAWHPTPVFLPGECCGQRNLVSPLSMGLQRVGHNLSYLAHTYTHHRWLQCAVVQKLLVRHFTVLKNWIFRTQCVFYTRGSSGFAPAPLWVPVVTCGCHHGRGTSETCMRVKPLPWFSGVQGGREWAHTVEAGCPVFGVIWSSVPPQGLGITMLLFCLRSLDKC